MPAGNLGGMFALPQPRDRVAALQLDSTSTSQSGQLGQFRVARCRRSWCTSRSSDCPRTGGARAGTQLAAPVWLQPTPALDQRHQLQAEDAWASGVGHHRCVRRRVGVHPAGRPTGRVPDPRQILRPAGVHSGVGEQSIAPAPGSSQQVKGPNFAKAARFPSSEREFDSRHPLQQKAPGQWRGASLLSRPFGSRRARFVPERC